MHRALTNLLLLLALALFHGSATATAQDTLFAWPAGTDQPAQGGGDFLPFDEAYRLDIEAGSAQTRLRWQIEPGYYLYRHGFRVLIDGDDITGQLTLPAGTRKQDEIFGAVEAYYRAVSIDLPAPPPHGYELEIHAQGCADAGLCYPVDKKRFDVRTDRPAVAAAMSSAPTVAANEPADAVALGLPLALLFAFAGGLILNLMPCVLPVLSLKALGMANSDETPRVRITHGWWYTAGITASFCLMAGLIISLKMAGATIGWGFQLQNAWFVAMLVYLFFMMALLLAGAADFSGSWMGFGQALTAGNRYRSSFFTGVLAAIVASPCTAPFMGAAMGFALTQDPGTSLLVFACLGLGMAFPFLLLSHLPGAGRWLPRPGPWMERFREFLAFPLLATAIWLLWVIGRQTGADGVALVLTGCLLLTLALWFNGTAARIQIARLSLAVSAVALLTSPLLQPQPSARDSVDRYSEQRVSELRREGVPVFVNFTADWCITCLANESRVLSSRAVQGAFAEHGVAYLKADWTNRNPEIARSLEKFGRSGIPLYLFYPHRGDDRPLILPQLLSVALVTETLRNSLPRNGGPDSQVAAYAPAARAATAAPALKAALSAREPDR